MKATEKEVHLYDGDLVPLGSHARLQRGSCQSVESPQHRAVKSDRYGLEPVQEAFLGLGPSAVAFLDGLTQRSRHHSGYHARAILSQKETYHSDDIHKAVERILIAKATPRTLESLRDEVALRRLQDSLPRIVQRPLAEYGLASLTKEKEDEDESEAENNSPAHPGA